MIALTFINCKPSNRWLRLKQRGIGHYYCIAFDKNSTITKLFVCLCISHLEDCIAFAQGITLCRTVARFFHKIHRFMHVTVCTESLLVGNIRNNVDSLIWHSLINLIFLVSLCWLLNIISINIHVNNIQIDSILSLFLCLYPIFFIHPCIYIFF